MFEGVEVGCDERRLPREGGEGVLVVERNGGDEAKSEGAEARDGGVELFDRSVELYVFGSGKRSKNSSPHPADPGEVVEFIPGSTGSGGSNRSSDTPSTRAGGQDDVS